MNLDSDWPEENLKVYFLVYIKNYNSWWKHPYLKIYIFLIDSKFFSVLCQALDVPFIIDDTNYGTKKCGFNNENNIKKLSIIKDLFEKHYVYIFYNKLYILIFNITILLINLIMINIYANI